MEPASSAHEAGPSTEHRTSEVPPQHQPQPQPLPVQQQQQQQHQHQHQHASYPPYPPAPFGPGQNYPQPTVSMNKVVSSKGWHNVKIVLSSFALVFDIVIIGIAAGLGGIGYDYYNVAIDLIFGLVPAVLSLLWLIADFITLCVRRDRSIHPGAQVALHLILALAAAVCGGMLTWLVVESDYDDYSSYYSYDDIADNVGMFRAMEDAILAFLYLLLVVHFTLFVRACVECHRRNKSKPTISYGGQPYPPAPYMVMAQQPPFQGGHMSQQPPFQGGHMPQQPPATYASPQPAELNPHHTAMHGYYAPQTTQHAPMQEHQEPSAVAGPSSVSPVSAEHLARHGRPEMTPA